MPEPWHLYALEIATTADVEAATAEVAVAPAAGPKDRRPAIAGAAVGFVAVGTIALGLYAVTSGGSQPPLVSGPDAAILLSTDGVQVGGQKVGNTPGDVIVGGGAIWVANVGSSTVTRFDPTGGPQLTIGGVGRPTSLAYESGANRLWVLDGLGAKLSIVDARNGQVLESFRQSGRGITYGADAIWIADEVRDSVVAIDPLSRQVVATIELSAGSAPVAVAVSEDTIWVAAKGSSTVERIDSQTRTRRGTGTPVTGAPTDIAAGTSIWAASGPADALIRLDPADGRVAQTLTDICDEPGGITATVDGAWLTCRRHGTVLRIEATGIAVTAQVGFVPNDVASNADQVWVTLAAE